MIISLDFETALVEPGLQAPPPVCLSAASESGAHVYLAEEGMDVFEQALESDYIIGANTAYESVVLCEARPHLFAAVFKAYDEDRITDVLIRQKLIDIALGEYRQHGNYDLAALSKRILDRHMEKKDTWRLRYWELAHLPLDQWPQDAVDYSRDDAIAPLDIYHEQDRELQAIDRLAVLVDQYRQARADFALKLASAWGLRTDRVGVEKLRIECETGRDALTPGLFEAGLLRTGKKKGEIVVSRCVRVAQARMKEVNPKARLTKTGMALKKKHDESYKEIKYISLDAEACEDSGDPLLEDYTAYSQLNNLLTGHVKAVAEGIHLPIHTHFEVLLETGRTSSSKPNVQNVRRAPGARECFVPREGHVYVGCDFDKAELHTLAQVCINLFGKSQLGEVLNAGIDPHTRLGARLGHTTYEDLTARIEAGDEVAEEWRQRAKPGNFGFPGGMGPQGMVAYAKSSYGTIITLQEARHLYGGWQDEYPVVSGDYLGWVRQLTAGSGTATIEHFDSGRWRGRVPYCVAANSLFQGMSADAMKAAMWEVIKRCYTPGTALYGCRLVNEIHDELIIEALRAQASEAAWEMQRVMIKAYNLYTRDVPVRATPVMMDRWSKKAKTIVENGELKLWRFAA